MRYAFATIATPAVIAGLLAAQPARAEAAPTDAEITVIATGTRLRVEQAGQPVTVLTAEALEAVQGPDLTRALARIPGLIVNRNGGQGAFTGVRLRGAESEQVLVLVDGVRVEDVSAPSGGFDFGTVTSGGLGRIDVLRGSNSVVWGSAAIGGVIALSSRELNGIDASIEGGSGNALTADATAGLASERYALTLNGGHARSDGLSSAAVSGREADGFSQWRVGGKGRVNLTPELSLMAAARYADTHTDMDGFPAPDYAFADTPEYQVTRQASGRAAAHYETAGLTLEAGYAAAATLRDYYDPTYGTAPSYGYKAHSERADLTGHIALPSQLALDVGGDSEWTRYSGTYDAEQHARLSSIHGLLGWYGDQASLSVGVRHDDHSRFGGAWTSGANGSVKLAGDVRLRASYGEGFKAPTLFQLLSDYGNAALVPERARSYDAGIEWGGERLKAAITLFRRDSRNLIAYVSCYGRSNGICANRPYGTYDNIGRARADGVEAELTAKPVTGLSLHLAWTYDRARNLTIGTANYGKDLARRSRHTFTASADWTTPLHALVIGADLRVRSGSFDDAANTVRIAGGAIADVRASLPVSERIELFGRVENLFDHHLPTVAGYGSPGRAGYGGIRVRY
ncbi:MAG: hypothetical protein RLZZ427_1873 [Pseudomonadota bacterium]